MPKRFAYDPQTDSVVEVGRGGLANGVHRPIVSDALGVTCHQVEEFRQDAKLHGFTGIDFVQDKSEPGFYQAHCPNPREWASYIKHRGMRDQNSQNGSAAPFTPEQFARLQERARGLTAEGQLCHAA